MELLVVMGILALLLVVALPAFNSISRASRLTNSGYMLEDTFKLARQMAVAQNRRVIVRFYKMNADVGTDLQYRAFRLFFYDPNGIPVAASPMKKLPTGVIMSEDNQFSTILTASQDFGNETIPGGTSVSYRAVEFGPDGSLKLDPEGAKGDKWFVTVVNVGEVAKGGLPGKNFITVMLDPITGRTKMFQP